MNGTRTRRRQRRSAKARAARQERQQRAAPIPGTGTNSLKYADTLRRIAEIEALKKANIVRTEAQTITHQGAISGQHDPVVRPAPLRTRADGRPFLQPDLEGRRRHPARRQELGCLQVVLRIRRRQPHRRLARFALQRSHPRGRPNTSRPSISCSRATNCTPPRSA